MKKTLKLTTALAVLTLLIASCSSTPAKNFTTFQDFQSQTLKWKTCFKEFECTDLLVPIDYTNFATGTFEIAVIRYKAADRKNRIGSLVVNPGGPGGSGVDYAYNAQYIFNPDILDRFDIVGFDPRGVSRSEPIDCYTDEETDASYAADSKPDTPEEFAQAVADAKDFVAKCQAQTKHLTHYSSAETARDMDILRAALGDKKLNYLGKSYGTYLGTLYAQFFPDKVGRMILDGAIDPNISILDQNISQAVGFENALYTFIKDCASFPNCPLPKDQQQAKDAITNLFLKAASNPLPQKDARAGDDRLATESILVLGTASALYDDTEGWPKLRKAIIQAQEGYGDTFLQLADIYSGRQENGKYITNELDSGAVIDCLDWRDSRSEEQLQKDVETFKAKAPVFGPYLANTGLACKYFPKPTKDVLTRATNKIKSIHTSPILIVGTKRDPATPYQWAVGLNKIIKNSILISLDADGHTGQGRGSECVDEAADRYFLTGKTPRRNIDCKL
jgi:pimeloyl-ACP methyl ester carboxylesterase